MISAFCEELSRDRTGFTRVKETYSQVKNAVVTREQNFGVKVRLREFTCAIKAALQISTKHSDM